MWYLIVEIVILGIVQLKKRHIFWGRGTMDINVNNIVPCPWCPSMTIVISVALTSLS